MLSVYLAGPIFTQAEQAWLTQLKGKLVDRFGEAGSTLEVIWPFETTPKNKKKSVSHAHDYREEILQICREGLDRADMVIAILDGTQVDDGTAWEVGYFFCKRLPTAPILGLRTDFRNAGDTYMSQVNSLIEASCLKILKTPEELATALLEFAKSSQSL